MIKGMLVYLPEETYRIFKSKIAKEGKSVKEVIISFVQLYCEEEGGGDKKNSGKDEK